MGSVGSPVLCRRLGPAKAQAASDQRANGPGWALTTNDVSQAAATSVSLLRGQRKSPARPECRLSQDTANWGRLRAPDLEAGSLAGGRQGDAMFTNDDVKATPSFCGRSSSGFWTTL